MFDAACMQRWNDKLRPIELTEMDKQAHKMMIAYFLGRIEEDKGARVDWIQIIEGGIYEYLSRAILTDIKPPIFYKIKQREAEYKRLQEWAYKEWEPMISEFEGRFFQPFLSYFQGDNGNINRKILNAAHIQATLWEYNVLEQFNQKDYERQDIKDRLEEENKKYCDLESMRELCQNNKLKQLIDLCGQLRYQLRWAYVHRIPRTSVLGHLLFVAIITYLLSIELSKENFGKRRTFNNFFTALFHDLPEVLTRDIVSPVKKSIQGLDDIIKAEEIKQMNEKIINLLPEALKEEMCLFTGILETSGNTIGEFDNAYFENDRYNICEDDVCYKYDEDRFKARDGKIVRAADHLAAFIEAYVASENGCSSKALHKALHEITRHSEDKVLDTIAKFMDSIYCEF